MRLFVNVVTSILLALSCSVVAQTNEIRAVSCSESDVITAITNASSGYTVRVPDGNGAECPPWTETITISDNKKLSIVGAGVGSTIIRRNTSGMIFNLGKSSSRISGFTFLLAPDSHAVRADGVGWRIDSSRFEATGRFVTAIWAGGEASGVPATGLIDHCQFVNGNVLAAPLQTKNDLSWSTELPFGSDKALYVEDSDFLFTEFGNAMDGNYGGAYVFRYNTVTDTTVEAHSVQGLGRALRHWEIYGNVIRQVKLGQNVAFFLRAGSGVIFNNTLIGSWSKPDRIGFDNVRSIGDTRFDVGLPGQCDGGSPWDGNEPLESGGSGVHASNSNGAVLQDSLQHWTSGALVGNWVWNLTDGSKGKITANSETTITTTLAGGTKNLWTNGDSYKVSNGYPCRDQIGRSTDEHLWTSGAPYPHQHADPVYIWSNREYASQSAFDKGAGKDVSVMSKPSTQIKPDRDFIVGACRPNYLPCPYPHPLTGLSPQQQQLNCTGAPPVTTRPRPPARLNVVP